jgi:hypothetical protein
MTVHAATREPADPDTLSDLGSFGVRTYGRDMTDDLVAENRGVLRNTPLIVQDGEIGVTHTAVFNSDFNILGPERSEIRAPSAVSPPWQPMLYNSSHLLLLKHEPDWSRLRLKTFHCVYTIQIDGRSIVSGQVTQLISRT